jgi:hypothetical protein
MFTFKNGVKQGEASWPLLLNFVLEYATRSVQVNQDGLILNGKHELLICVYYVIISGGSEHTLEKMAET